MSAWHEGIYGNDDAQDFLGILAGLYQESEDLEEFLTLAREHTFNRYADCRFVLADLECDLVGELDYPQDVFQMIEEELSPESLSRWTNVSRRQAVLNGFKMSLAQRLAHSHPDDYLSFEDIPTWIQEKMEAGVFESVA